MADNYESIDEALDIESGIVEVEKTSQLKPVEKTKNDIEKDYEYTRANLYSLIEKGQEAINGIMELAGEGASPRAYEVAGQLIKSVADTTDKLIDLQKKLKDIEEDAPKTTNNVTADSADWWKSPVNKDITIVTLTKSVRKYLKGGM